MPIITTIKRWLRRLFTKTHREDLLSGVSATPEFPDPVSLVSWILMSYRHHIDSAACFSLEHVQGPFIRLVQGDTTTDLMIRYSPPFSPAERLKAIGIHLPDGFVLTDWKRHEHFTLTGPRVQPNEMASFLDLLFRKLYRAEKGYVLVAWTDIHPASHPPQPSAQDRRHAERW
ncbi:hypothetical protein [Desulfoluna spongiiphila]|uniref:Uncharacterized protein n=1 Tax=Desulfoluna spongiiphila TaxID=419481 RepID=A0A1G5DCF5_9BACT|nr:hypothetical protein [Desulfoluna spongiiphila]SCY12294.1 hypothetical protein SAMN05216233_104105 [Desulfoluna spongiiphila]VVS95218.1 hypothetical protein DBB_47950 [Desulfoluna spongiiphila]